MRSRILPAVGISVIALVAAASFAGTADASSHGPGVAAKHAAGTTAPAKGGACYSLTTDDSGVGIVSQDFTDSGYDIYDSSGAANFSVKKKCSIKTVSTTGVYFNGAGPADSVNVIVYKAKKGVPGAIVNEQDGLSYTDTTGLGSLSAKVKTIKLKKGSYFVSVTASMAFAAGGEWGWELSTDINGNEDVWQNPGGGLGTTCTTWADNTTCLGYSGDYMVTIGK